MSITYSGQDSELDHNGRLLYTAVNSLHKNDKKLIASD